MMDWGKWLQWAGVAVALALQGCTDGKLASTTGGGAPVAEQAQAVDQTSEAPAEGQEVATFAGGCFWCVEAIFQDLKGVSKVESGYTGGHVPNPTYEQVCTGTTGHAEALRITYDPKQISYPDLLRIFLTTHDPTTLNRQGADVGTQYRSAIFTHSEEQEKAARQVIAEVQRAGIWDDPIVTEVTPAAAFYKAEDYHQNYYKRNPNQGYCRVVIAPKVAKFREKYREMLAR